jgi:hypothetical protein
MQLQQKVLNSMQSEPSKQKLRYRPDEEPYDQEKPDVRMRGARIKLSAKGDKRQHKKRKSRRR